MLKLITTALNGNLLKTLGLALLFCGVSQSSFSQSLNLENQSQIVEYLGDSRFNELLQSNPSYLSFLDTRCSVGYKVIDMGIEKTEGMTVLNSVSYEEWVVPEKAEEQVFKSVEFTSTPEEFVLDSNNPDFNILKYNLSFDKNVITYYVLGSTGKVIMIYPVEYINQQVN